MHPGSLETLACPASVVGQLALIVANEGILLLFVGELRPPRFEPANRELFVTNRTAPVEILARVGSERQAPRFSRRMPLCNGQS